MLARAVQRSVEQFAALHQQLPRLVLLENHGLIAPAATPEGALAATLMAEKAATIFTAAAACDGPRFLTDGEADVIEARQDEAYRRQQLKL